MWLKYPIIIVLFFLLALLQISFLPYFAITGVVPNLVFVLFFILIFFNPNIHKNSTQQSGINEYYEAFFYIIIAGGMLDIFSALNFGTSILFLCVIYFLIRIITSYFLKIPAEETLKMPGEIGKTKTVHLLVYVSVIFLISLIVYDLLEYVFLDFPHFPSRPVFFIQLSYNLALAMVMVMIYQGITNHPKKKQLTLFR